MQRSAVDEEPRNIPLAASAFATDDDDQCMTCDGDCCSCLCTHPKGPSDGAIRWRKRSRTSALAPQAFTGVDAQISEELWKLSLSERERVLNDIHGVSDTIQEEPSFVETRLRQLDSEILRIRNRSAYEKALFFNPDYVRDRKFRLMFLRADRFDPRLAAARMVSHFEKKLYLWGVNKIARDITFDDLEEEDRKILMAGGLWTLPTYDRSNRRIMLASVGRINFGPKAENNFRHIWYMLMMALEDVKTQKNGIVLIIFSTGMTLRRYINTDTVLRVHTTFESIPFRFAATHFCYEDRMPQSIVPNPITVLQLGVGMINRVRFRAHHGSPIEMTYALVSFGIPAKDLPLDDNGELEHDLFLKDIERRRQYEKDITTQLSKANVILNPTHRDVLMGRGRPYQDYPGNVRLSKLVLLEEEKFNDASSTRHDKTIISMQIVQSIQKSGGRFLRRKDNPETNGEGEEEDKDGGTMASSDNNHHSNSSSTVGAAEGAIPSSAVSGWEEVDNEIARKKVSTSFRTRKRLQNRANWK